MLEWYNHNAADDCCVQGEHCWKNVGSMGIGRQGFWGWIRGAEGNFRFSLSWHMISFEKDPQNKKLMLVVVLVPLIMLVKTCALARISVLSCQYYLAPTCQVSRRWTCKDLPMFYCTLYLCTWYPSIMIQYVGTNTWCML